MKFPGTLPILLPLLFCSVQSDLQKIYDGVGGLSWNLLTQNYRNGENIVYSSMSISKALAMCLVGAEGSTLEVMKETMGLSGESIEEIVEGYREYVRMVENLRRKPQKNFILNEANRIYLNESLRIRQSFSDDVRNIFGTDTKRVNFQVHPSEVKQEVNRFVADATQNLIPEVLTEPFERRTLFAIVNALYFKGAWLNRMSVDSRDLQKFNDLPSCSALRAREAVWLTVQKTLKYSSSKEIAADLVELPYVSEETSELTASMILILPHEKQKCDLHSWIKTLTWKKIRNAIGEMLWNEVILKLPEVDTESRFELARTLRDLGMGEAFSEKANFSRIFEENSVSDLKIDEIIHQAKLKIDKEGTEAAAATSTFQKRMIFHRFDEKPPIRLTLNRSFVGMIILRRGKAIAPLFTSVIDSPK